MALIRNTRIDGTNTSYYDTLTLLYSAVIKFQIRRIDYIYGGVGGIEGTETSWAAVPVA